MDKSQFNNLNTPKAMGFQGALVRGVSEDKLKNRIGEITNSDRVRVFIASSDHVDRAEEVILPRGLDFGNYTKNPVFLTFHNYDAMPIGRTVAYDVRKRDGVDELLMAVEFDTEANDPEAASLLRKVDAGMINAVSIGVRPTAAIYDWDDKSKIEQKIFDKYNARAIYTKCEFLELSLVPVPMNPHAVAAHQKSMEMRHGLGANSKTNSGPISITKQSEGNDIEGTVASRYLNKLVSRSVDGDRTRSKILEEISEDADCSVRTIRNILKGSPECPKIKYLESFAKVLGTELTIIKSEFDVNNQCNYKSEKEMSGKAKEKAKFPDPDQKTPPEDNLPAGISSDVGSVNDAPEKGKDHNEVSASNIKDDDGDDKLEETASTEETTTDTKVDAKVDVKVEDSDADKDAEKPKAPKKKKPAKTPAKKDDVVSEEPNADKLKDDVKDLLDPKLKKRLLAGQGAAFISKTALSKDIELADVIEQVSKKSGQKVAKIRLITQGGEYLTNKDVIKSFAEVLDISSDEIVNAFSEIEDSTGGSPELVESSVDVNDVLKSMEAIVQRMSESFETTVAKLIERDSTNNEVLKRYEELGELEYFIDGEDTDSDNKKSDDFTEQELRDLAKSLEALNSEDDSEGDVEDSSEDED